MPNGLTHSWETLKDLSADPSVDDTLIIRQMIGHFADYIRQHEEYQEQSNTARKDMENTIKEIAKAVENIQGQVEDISEIIKDNKVVEIGVLYRKHPKLATAVTIVFGLIIYLSTWNSIRFWVLKVFLTWLGLPDDLAETIAPQ